MSFEIVVLTSSVFFVVGCLTSVFVIEFIVILLKYSLSLRLANIKYN